MHVNAYSTFWLSPERKRSPPAPSEKELRWSFLNRPIVPSRLRTFSRMTSATFFEKKGKETHPRMHTPRRHVWRPQKTTRQPTKKNSPTKRARGEQETNRKKHDGLVGW